MYLCEGNYVLAYTLRATPIIINVKNFSDIRGLKIYGILHFLESSEWVLWEPLYQELTGLLVQWARFTPNTNVCDEDDLSFCLGVKYQ